MKTVSAALLGVAVVVFAGTAKAQDDNAKKLVGVWVVDKNSGELPEGSTVEFTKDGKLNIVVKSADELKLSGTYKVEKDKLNIKLKFGDMDIDETITIKKLTDEVLEVEDKDKKVDTFKKKK